MVTRKLTEEVINTILCDFIGWRFMGFIGNGEMEVEYPPCRGSHTKPVFSRSLDSQIPIWEKLDTTPSFFGFKCQLDIMTTRDSVPFDYKDMPLAAAKAAVKAIQVINAANIASITHHKITTYPHLT